MYIYIFIGKNQRRVVVDVASSYKNKGTKSNEPTENTSLIHTHTHTRARARMYVCIYIYMYIKTEEKKLTGKEKKERNKVRWEKTYIQIYIGAQCVCFFFFVI